MARKSTAHKTKDIDGPKRTELRFRADVPAVLHYRGHDYECRAHDLSRSGTMLRGPVPWPSDEVVSFTVRSLQGDIIIELRGRVAWLDQDDGGEGTRIGVEFEDLSPEEQSAIENLRSRVMAARPSGSFDSLKPGTPPHEIRKVLENIPIAQRISLATRAIPKQQPFLRHDPNPAVLEALARNPNLLLGEARALVKVPFILASTLQILANDVRWMKDEEMKITIATHPRVPLALAKRLIDRMNVPALRRLLRVPSLNATFRTSITRRIARGG